MQLSRWVGFCALIGGAGVVLIEPVLGREGALTLTGANSDLRIMGGAVALVGVLTLIIGGLADQQEPRRKGQS